MKPAHGTLIEAAMAGDLLSLSWHVAHGANPNQIYEAAPGKFVSTLTLTASGGPLIGVTALLSSGANPNADPSKGGSPLGAAIVQGRREIVDVLLEHGADPNKTLQNGDTPVHMAANLEAHEIYDVLVRAGGRQDIVNDRGITPRQVRDFLALQKMARG